MISRKNQGVFDFHEYSHNSRFWCQKQKVTCKIENKITSVSIIEFVGLHVTMHQRKKQDNEGGKKAKVIDKKTTKNMNHKEYKNMLFEKNKNKN